MYIYLYIDIYIYIIQMYRLYRYTRHIPGIQERLATVTRRRQTLLLWRSWLHNREAGQSGILDRPKGDTKGYLWYGCVQLI